jgi:pimeloyl-ACP methyl ester carboxylesterase
MLTRRGYAISRVDDSPIYYSVSEPRAPTSGARTLVLCDGIGCDGYVWKYLRRDLGRDHRIIHWHYRGHGRTPAPRARDRLSIADLSDDLASVLDDSDTAEAVVLGHSMGVQVSLESYRRHGSRVAALVLLCGAASNPLRTFKGNDRLEHLLPRVRAAVATAPRLFGSMARALLPTRVSLEIAKLLEVNAELLEEADFRPYLEGIARIEPGLFLGMLAEAGAHSAMDMLGDIRVPTLIVAGSRDGFTPAELSRAMHEGIPGSELLVVEHGSHTAPIERPHYVNAHVRDFLRRLPPCGHPPT